MSNPNHADFDLSHFTLGDEEELRSFLEGLEDLNGVNDMDVEIPQLNEAIEGGELDNESSNSDSDGQYDGMVAPNGQHTITDDEDTELDVDTGIKKFYDLFVDDSEAMTKLTNRVHPANPEGFKTALIAAVNSEHSFKEILESFPNAAQWREIIRYVHFVCDPTGCRTNIEVNREAFYEIQRGCSAGPQSSIYKKNTEGKNVRELHNLYEFSLLLNTMEWMMSGEQWIEGQKRGGAGGVRGITNLLSPLEPGNPDGHDYGDTDTYERRRRKDLIERKFPLKERKAKTQDNINVVSPAPKRVRKAKSTASVPANVSNQAAVPVVPVVIPPSPPQQTTPAALVEAPLDITTATNEILARKLWFESAEKGDVKTIREMIQLSADANNSRPWKADVNWRDERKMTALSKAALNMEVSAERTETVQFLLQHGADPALQDVCGGFPLYYACCCDQVDILRFLVVHPRTKLNVVQEHGTDSLHIAANLGHVDTVELLLTQKHRLKINQQMEKNKRTALMGAITSQGKYHNRLRIVQLLLDAGCNKHLVSNDGYTAYMLACQRGQRDTAELIYHHGLELAEESVQMDSSNINGFDDEGSAIELDEDTTFAAFREALFRAAVYGNVDEAGRLLFFAQQDLERRDWIDVNHLQGATTLVVLAQLGFSLPNTAVAANMALRLLTAGADPNIPNEGGQLPLLLAASAGLDNSVAIMRFLLSHGAKVNAQNPRKESALSGETALLAAARLGHLEAVQCLIQAGADPNLGNSVGMLPFMAAAKAGLPASVDIMAYVLQSAVIDANARNKAGETALFLAAQSGHLEVVQFLLHTAGADPYVPNNEEQSPKEAARVAGHVHFYELLPG